MKHAEFTQQNNYSGRWPTGRLAVAGWLMTAFFDIKISEQAAAPNRAVGNGHWYIVTEQT